MALIYNGNIRIEMAVIDCYIIINPVRKTFLLILRNLTFQYDAQNIRCSLELMT